MKVAEIIQFDERRLMIRKILKLNNLTEKQMTNLYNNYIKDLNDDAPKDWKKFSLMEISLLIQVLKR